MRSPRNEPPVLEHAESLPRLVVARTLHEHPEWSLEDLFGVIARGGPRAAVLGGLTIAELLSCEATKTAPRVDRVRLRRATQIDGADFDQLVFEVLCEAPREVASSYVRARLGGPRWKLQASLRRLIAAGRIERTGNTSGVRYTATEEP